MATLVAERIRTRTPWSQRWLEGAGAAILLAPGILWGELSPSHEDRYHRLLPQTTVIRALAIDLILLSLLGMLVSIVLDAIARREFQEGRPPRRPIAPLLWSLWLAMLAAECVNGLIFEQLIRWQVITDFRVFLLVSELLLLLWIFSSAWYQQCIRGLRYGLMLLGVCILWMVPVLIAESLQHQPWDREHFSRPVPAAAVQHQRIVWVLFDGMSYDQVFDHRSPQLQLPNLDKLRQTSVTFSNMGPGGTFTENVIPSIFLGNHIVQVQGTSSGALTFQESPGAPWQSFDPDDTIFADAERAGWTTGIAGWFNPYCRLFPKQLDFCWMQLAPLPDNFSRNNSTLRNVIAPLTGRWTDRDNVPNRAPSADVLDQLNFLKPGEALIAKPGINFSFIHLPIPHAPNRYNRRTGKLAPNGSYLDNLALCDLVLGRLRDEIRNTPAADRTTLILSSDHSWRVWMWRNHFGWTQEDEIASRGGVNDDRPMLMVSFPGEQHPTTIANRVPLLNMHGMIEDILTGKIENRQQLTDWAARQ